MVQETFVRWRARLREEPLRPIGEDHLVHQNIGVARPPICTAGASTSRSNRHSAAAFYPTSRAFLHWRLSDDGARASGIVAMGRHPKPFTFAANGWHPATLTSKSTQADAGRALRQSHFKVPSPTNLSRTGRPA
jgi:hypothetical protein